MTTATQSQYPAVKPLLEVPTTRFGNRTKMTEQLRAANIGIGCINEIFIPLLVDELADQTLTDVAFAKGCRAAVKAFKEKKPGSTDNVLIGNVLPRLLPMIAEKPRINCVMLFLQPA